MRISQGLTLSLSVMAVTGWAVYAAAPGCRAGGPGPTPSGTASGELRCCTAVSNAIAVTEPHVAMSNLNCPRRLRPIHKSSKFGCSSAAGFGAVPTRTTVAGSETP
jgi:hypothetical protein